MKNSTFSAQVANNLLTLLQGYTKGIRFLLVMFLTLTVSAEVWGATTTYTFTSKSWADTSNGWTSGKDGNALTSNLGVQVTTGVTGANATTKNSFTNISRIDVQYCTNASKGAGSIKIQVGSNTQKSFSVTKPSSSGTTLKTATFTFDPNETGKVKITVDCTTNSVYIYSVAITTADAVTCTTPPTVSAGSSSNVAATTATVSCSGGITSLGSAGCSIESYGFVYGTSSNPTISNSKVQVGTTYTTTGTAFTKELTGLTANTTYYVRPYATNGNGTAYGTQTSFKTLELPKYTVTLNAGPGTCAASVTETSAGAGVDLPTPTLCDGWTFAGWATSAVATETSSKPATLLTGTYKPTSNITLYAVYQRTEETEGNGSETEVTKSVSISNYATANSWTNDTKYTSVTIDENITATASTGTNTGKYYTSGTNWRFYQTEKATLTLSAATECTIKTIKVTYSVSNTGTLTYSGSNVASNTVTTINATSATFGVGNTGSATNGQVRITAISVTYTTTSAGGTIITTYYHSTPDCAAGDPCDALQAPNVTATATANSITLSWAAVDGATSYNIYNFTTEDLDETTSLTYTFTGLSSETEYEWGVESAKDECFKETRGTTTTSATPCEQLGAATGLTVETDFVHTDGQTYVKFSWTPADNTKANATNQKICFGKVGEAGTCVDDLEKNLTWTGDLKSKLAPGEYWWSIQALGDGVKYCDGNVINGTNFTIEAPKASITLSELGVTTTDNTTYSVGDQYTLPTISSQSCAGKQLVGWSTVEVAETDTKPTEKYYERGAEVTLTATQTFYAVFAAGSGGGGGAYTKVTIISDGTYLIAASKDENTSYAYTGVVTGKTYGGYTDVTITDDKITTKPNDALEITVKVSDNNFSMYDGTNYLCLTSDGNNLNFNDSIEKIEWTLSDGKIQNTNITSSTRYLQFNASSGSERFACYKNTQKDAYLYKKTGGGYTAYSTSCVASYSITYDFAGGTGSHCSNTSVPQGDSYTICNEEPAQEGYTFQGWSDGTTTYNAGATITPSSDVTLTAVWKANTYTVTWNNNGKTTSKTYNHGDALVVPDAPASCDGVKEFVGWTTHSGYYHATTAPDDLFKTTTATVTADKTYYAVFATPPTTGGGGSIETTDDVLTRETTEVTSGSTTYASWSGKTATSSAVYAGNSAGSNNAIQLRSDKNTSGIVTTTSGGKITHVEVEWQSATITDRKLDIYGRNVAYSAATDLYSTSTQGTKLGSITCGTSTELEITGDYEYIGLRSNSGAMYLASVTITWSSAGGSSSHTDYTTTCQEVTGIALSGSYPTTFIQFDAFSFAGGIVTATLENGTTQDVTELATFSGYNMDEVGVQTVTVTYMGQTAKYEITINQSDRWRLTWNVSGKTNTGASPIYVQKDSAIGTLPIPEVPAACAGKTFMGWTESNVVNSDGSGITYITKETVPTANTTYYAVFATVNNFSVQKPINDITDGSKVVIVAVASLDNTGSTGKAISSRTISITSKGVIGLAGDDVAIFDETINTPHNTCIWTLTKQGETVAFEQGSKYIRATDDGYRRLVLDATADYWTLITVAGKDKTYHMKSGNTSHYVEWFDHTDSKYDEGERYIGFIPYTEANNNGDFDMQFFVVAGDGQADITDYTTGCAEYTITYYGFQGGYSTSCSSDGTIVLPVNSLHTIPNCGDVVKDHTNLNRTFTGVWMTKPHGGQTFKPGDTFILTQDTTLYAQWELNTQNDFTTLPTDIEDLAGTDIYVYGGKTLTLQPGTTTINSLTLKGGIQTDGSYQMPSVWVPEGATLVRNSNKINLDLIVNAKTYYPFAVPFATKNNQYVEYLDSVLAAASTYGTHFAIKTYDGARRAKVGEDKANNWVRVRRDSTLQPGVGYIITALTYPDKDTATIRIPMTVPNTWFKNGEQAVVGTTVRNTIDVTAHTGEAATEHQRHAGWNFVANPYLTSFAGGNVANDGDLAYINGELIIEGSYEYGGEDVPYVTVPAYDFAYYSQHKLSDVKLSPEWSFFVQVGTSGTMNFTTAGRQQAPASIAARNAEERPVKMDVDITLSDNHSSDQTGIIISDRYNDTYEIGRDLEKLFGSAYNLSVYTLMADNTPLAFQALAIRSSMQVIPVGYRAPEQGEYTFRLNEATSSIDLLNEQYEQLVLVDYQTGELINLLISDYTFYSERTQADNRFAIYAVPRQNAPTDLPNAIGQDKEAQKIIHNGHLYILRDGNVYNGNGQIVK